jgi:hypothetical protein
VLFHPFREWKTQILRLRSGAERMGHPFHRLVKGAPPGLSVLARRKWRETAAKVLLRTPGELKGFLERWVEAGNRD